MKKFVISFLFLILSFGQLAFGDQSIPSMKDENVQILDLVMGVHRTYSVSSGLDAKVIEILAGDGMNPTRMALVLNTGYQDTKIFELGIMMSSVKRIVFLDIDVIVINYLQDDFDKDMNQIIRNRSITLKVQRNKDGTLADQLKVLE